MRARIIPGQLLVIDLTACRDGQKTRGGHRHRRGGVVNEIRHVNRAADAHGRAGGAAAGRHDLGAAAAYGGEIGRSAK